MVYYRSNSLRVASIAFKNFPMSFAISMFRGLRIAFTVLFSSIRDENRFLSDSYATHSKIEMMRKNVPGFCKEVNEICEQVFKCSFEKIVSISGDIREELKKKLIKIQEARLRKLMIVHSKTDSLLFKAFKFDGKKKVYLKLPFQQARIIFMIRCRMLHTKQNFPGRWIGTNCNVCGNVDTDAHLFKCPGFSDLVEGLNHEMFFRLEDMDIKDLGSAAVKMIK